MTPMGQHMAAEIAEAPEVFTRAVAQVPDGIDSDDIRAIYTVARGSSDAAANILSYEMMNELGLPVTSLPPSLFSIGAGVDMADAAALIVSQSGASTDLVATARGAGQRGAQVWAITNQPGSDVEAEAACTLPIGAGPELAVPATKTVIGSIGAGMALLSALSSDYAGRAAASAETFARIAPCRHPLADQVRQAFLRARHVYVIGRDTGYGAAQEIALKVKETCAIHAEAYSASEVLHGPLQLATNALTVLILDTGSPATQDSLDLAETRFRDEGCDVMRIRTSDLGAEDLTPAAAAALLLYLTYPVVLETALALGLNPDAPETLSKVTQTR